MAGGQGCPGSVRQSIRWRRLHAGPRPCARPRAPARTACSTIPGRLRWLEGTRVFELDRPAVLRRKEGILRAAGAVPACVRCAVEADLAGKWGDALLRAGFDPGEPSGWLAARGASLLSPR
ncbi:MAG: class I SAM-dependent methyltransferase [Candidatus Limnocylindrales bacterium]